MNEPDIIHRLRMLETRRVCALQIQHKKEVSKQIHRNRYLRDQRKQFEKSKAKNQELQANVHARRKELHDELLQKHKEKLARWLDRTGHTSSYVNITEAYLSPRALHLHPFKPNPRMTPIITSSEIYERDYPCKRPQATRTPKSQSSTKSVLEQEKKSPRSRLHIKPYPLHKCDTTNPKLKPPVQTENGNLSFSQRLGRMKDDDINNLIDEQAKRSNIKRLEKLKKIEVEETLKSLNAFETNLELLESYARMSPNSLISSLERDEETDTVYGPLEKLLHGFSLS